ncbi:MAG TPA: hypothetical protein DCL41_06580 [Bdellovibrionales bacterium]|nr:hypothetical protein [Pseudobdellovibrionaceae bacterium]HAG91517.1 hypothetical protein [Bdellovibrionales bacterium]|tara:strand:+ start:131581 stop:133023 length:1443 start_codon:yes stop_codon:yes gene_type:complete
MAEQPKNLELNYVIVGPRSPITLDLFEAERYESAVIVQQLIGNLVYHSNQGRYEPRLAKSWERVSPNQWQFELRENLFCENGEQITPSRFRESLLRSIKNLSENREVPIFNKLVGYENLKNGDFAINGILSNEKTLTFTFNEPVRSGLVEILSFAPFGYISSTNLTAEGHWRDKESFISSGPYVVTQVQVGKRYVLEKNPCWNLERSSTFPSKVIFTHEVPKSITDSELWIVDNALNSIEPPQGLEPFPLFPEYLNAILLGNLDSGLFAKKENRSYLRSLIDKHRSSAGISSTNHIKSETFYPNQKIEFQKERTLQPLDLGKEVLTIEGQEPIEDGSPRFYSWSSLKPALDEGGFKYQFANNSVNWKSMSDPSFDIRLRSSSVGKKLEPWGIGVVFCSNLGIRLPDPSGKICALVKSYEQNQLSEKDFESQFFETIDADCAIIPMSHYGLQLYISPYINQNSIHPTLSVMKFDQLEIDSN